MKNIPRRTSLQFSVQKWLKQHCVFENELVDLMAQKFSICAKGYVV